MRLGPRTKKRIKIISTLISIVILTSSTFAFFVSKDTATNNFKVQDLTIKIEEPNWKEPDSWNGEDITKDAHVTNTNTIPEFIRVAIEPRFADEDGNFYMGNVNDITFTYDNLTEDSTESNKWINGNDGYFYYTSIVKEGESTTHIIKSLKLNISEIDSDKYDGLTLNAVVRAEAVISNSSAFKTNWKIKNDKIIEMYTRLSI